ncbi:geranylgeranyl reductase family protein [Sanguibacter sp. A247]|uniref:geranylgeranyl reductase family protein n=1 Tax=unclassified Sanguibacter TaxID=2645534 RepID=UPI003FD7026D
MAMNHPDDADVVVVGAGPAGATAAHYLASVGLDVVVLDKARFPRDKICGDGLTPRAVAELVRAGVSIDESDGWIRNVGLRVVGGGHRIEIPWPELSSYPSYGLARSRMSFDHMLVEHARASGATILEGHSVTEPVLDERTGRVVGVTARVLDADGRRTGEERTFRAPVVMAADGVSSRLATAIGIEKRNDRPMGVAVRTYFESPRHQDAWMESHLELWDGAPGESNLMPGYGWIFALGDGTVNVGLGSVSSSAAATKVDYKDLFGRWMANVPAEWGFSEETQRGPVRGAALPMAFNRAPLYDRGLMLLGDAGGMVSPFNGEGIAYAMQAARVASDTVAQALTRPTDSARERALHRYAQVMKDDLGGYYRLGTYFVKLIENPHVMHLCTKYGLPRPLLMKFVMKLLSDGYEPRGGDLMDRVIAGLTRVVPAA